MLEGKESSPMESSTFKKENGRYQEDALYAGVLRHFLHLVSVQLEIDDYLIWVAVVGFPTLVTAQIVGSMQLWSPCLFSSRINQMEEQVVSF